MNSNLVLLVLAIFGSAFGTDLQKCRQMIECVRKALDGGVPEIDLPSFNPLRIPFKKIKVNTNSVNVTLNLTDVVITNLVDFQIKELIALGKENDENTAAFNYSLFWPEMKLTAKYSLDFNMLNYGHYSEIDYFNVTLKKVHFDGMWDMTLENQPELQNFYLEPYADDILDNYHIVPDNSIERILRTAAIQSLNDMIKHKRNEIGDYISPLIKEVLNAEWIVGGQERIRGIMNNCKRH